MQSSTGAEPRGVPDDLQFIDCDAHWTEPADLWTARRLSPDATTVGLRPLVRRYPAQLPQGRKAARVSGLWRVCEGSLFPTTYVGWC